MFVEQEVPGDIQRNKPDLVITSTDQKTAHIVAVMIPFEGEDNLTKARERKVEKYQELRRWMMEEKGYREVHLDAFIVGSLGSWDPANEVVLKSLQIHRNYMYAKLFRKLCVSSILSRSFDVWRAHCRH